MANFYELKQTFAKFSTIDRDETLRRLADDLRGMQQRWPRKVDFSRLLPDCAVAIFPLFFAEAFGRIDDARLSPFLAGCNMLASTIMVADSLFDEELERDKRTSLLLCWQGAQFEFQRELAKAFPAESPFWPCLGESLAQYLGCVATEAAYAARRRRLSDATPSECVAIALAKSCVSRVTIVGLRLLGDDVSRADALLQSLEQHNLARQIWDDVQDWKADLCANRPTLVTVRLATALQLHDTPPSAFDLNAIAREFHYGGHAEEFLELARTTLAAALDAADRERPLPWHALLEGLDRTIAALQSDLRTIVRRKRDCHAGGAVAV